MTQTQTYISKYGGRHIPTIFNRKPGLSMISQNYVAFCKVSLIICIMVIVQYVHIKMTISKTLNSLIKFYDVSKFLKSEKFSQSCKKYPYTQRNFLEGSSKF